MKPGLSAAAGRRWISSGWRPAIQQRHPQTAAGRTIRIAPVYDDLVEGVRWGLLVLQSAVGLVLLIACANVSSLLIARASGRRRELAIRAALGAGRGRLVRQLLTESLVLSVLGGLAGLLLGTWLIRLIVRVLPDAVPRADQIGIDPVVATGALLMALLTAALFGVVPSLQASRTDAATAMKQGGDRGSSGRARGRAVLVIGEVALTLVLLAGAGLLLNSFLRLRQVDSGMRPENVTVLSLALPSSRYATEATQGAAYGRLLEALSSQPAIQAVGVGFPGPLRGGNASGSFFIEGRASTDRSDQPNANLGSVSGRYFEAMGIPLVAGRTFAESRWREGRRRRHRQRHDGAQVLARRERHRQARPVRQHRARSVDHHRRHRRRRATARARAVRAAHPLHPLPPVRAAVHQRGGTQHGAASRT